MNLSMFIMPGLCVLLGLIMLFLFNKKEKDSKKKVLEGKEVDKKESCQDFINIKRIDENRLITNDDYRIAFIQLDGVCIDLYNREDKLKLINILTAEIGKINYPFSLISLERPFDIDKLKDDYNSRIQVSEDIQRQLLIMFLKQLKDYQSSGKVTERLFYIKLWEKCSDNDLNRKVSMFKESFESAKIRCKELNKQEIGRLINLFNNPSVYANDEVLEELLQPTAPIIDLNRKEKEDVE